MPNADVPNAQQRAGWDGPDGEHWATNIDRYDQGPRRITPHLLDGAAVAPGDRVLDVGCGAGGVTRVAARAAGDGSALGVDLSSAMLAIARSRSAKEGISNVTFEQVDAQVHPFETATFDLVLSRFGVMFFDDPVAAFGNMHHASRPGGRLAFLTWRSIRENDWVMTVQRALAEAIPLPEPPPGPGPFSLTDADDIGAILERAAYRDVHCSPVDEPMYLGSDADDAFAFVRTVGFVRGALERADAATEAQALDSLRTELARHESSEGVWLDSAAFLVTALA